MTSRYKVMCGSECCKSNKSTHSSLFSWRDSYLKNLRIKVLTQKPEGLLKFPMVYLRHIKIPSWHMVSIYPSHHLTWIWQKVCAYPPSKYVLPHCKCVLRYFEQYPCIDITSTELYQQNSNFSPTILFCVYHLIICCTAHGKHTLNENKQCQFCEASSDSILTTKLYTKKSLPSWTHQ